MDYQEFIDLGFKRTDMYDSVEFKQTGYAGFILSKKLNDSISIEVGSGSLDKPNLYVKKLHFDDNYHIMAISCDYMEAIIAAILKKDTCKAF